MLTVPMQAVIAQHSLANASAGYHKWDGDPSQQLPKLIGERQLADWLDVSLALIRKWRSNGNGPPVIHPGGSRLCRYDIADVHTWLSAASTGKG